MTCPVIRILLTMLSALGLGLFFYMMRSSMGWAVFGILFGGGICHCVVEIIYHFDFKKLFSHKLQLVCCLVASLLIMVVFRYDLLGYDRYLPKAGQVREAAVHVDRTSDWVSYGPLPRQGLNRRRGERTKRFTGTDIMERSIQRTGRSGVRLKFATP